MPYLRTVKTCFPGARAVVLAALLVLPAGGCLGTGADGHIPRAAGGAARSGSRRCPDGAAIYETLRRASVEVLVDGHMAGSGCFVDAEGLVLTAAHVVKGSGDGIEVLSPVAGRRRAARLAVDIGHDLALLSVGAPALAGKLRCLPAAAGTQDARVVSLSNGAGEGGGPYPSLEIAEQMPAPMAGVLLFSSPLWRHDIVLKGSVASSVPSYCWGPALRCYARCFYIAGASPAGSSGGSWVDSRGRVVGVQLGYLNNKDKSPVGIAFAAPPDAIRTLLATRRSQAAATLGGALEELWTQPKGFIARLPKGTEGIVTPVLHEDGALAKGGLTSETVITAADGEPVAYLDDLLSVVRSKKPGDEITLKVIEPIGTPGREVRLRLGEVKY